MTDVRVFIAVIIAVSVTATLSCPPGFVPQGNSCVCAHWPNGMVVCDEDSLTASMQIGYCMTYVNETGEVRAGRCSNEMILVNSTIHFLLTHLISMTKCVANPIAKVCSVESARMVLLFHL